MCVCDIADKDEHVHAPNIEILGHGDDEAVHDDRGNDGSVAAGEKDHHVGDEGVPHRTLNDSAHRADIFHSTVSATNRDHQERGIVQRKKIRTEFSRILANHHVRGKSSQRDLP